MKMFRMPTAFGNSPGPRSDLAGHRYDWSKARRRVLRWQSPVEAALLKEFLPARCSLDGPPRLQFEFQQLENLPWLAGRGYTLFSIKVPVQLQLSSGATRAFSFLLVMWENLADPIITGREELGFAKLFADLHWQWNDSSLGGVSAEWCGYEFFKLTITAPSLSPSYMQPTPPDMLHHRYVPAIGQWGEAALEEFVYSPGGLQVSPVSQVDCTVTFDFNAGKWEDLPTLWHIVSKLEALHLVSSSQGKLMDFVGGTDHAGQAVLR